MQATDLNNHLELFGEKSIHGLNVLCQHFREKTNRREGEREETSERTKAENRDQKDRDDYFLQGAADCDDPAAYDIDRKRRNVTRGPQSDRDRDQDALC